MTALEIAVGGADVVIRRVIVTAARGALNATVAVAHFALGFIGAACDQLGGRR